MVGLNQSNARGLVLTLNDGGIVSRGKCFDDGGFAIVGRDPGGFNLGLLSILPVIVRRDGRALDIV
jgi:hypothetical protein